MMLTLGTLEAQISGQVRYHSGLGSHETITPAQSTIDASVHYWTRLPRHRMEFYPGVIIQNHQTFDQGNYQNLGLSLPIAFYPLDFVNDCDCPTFSKNAFWFQKGFFIRLVPTWTFNIHSPEAETYGQLLGVGLSMGLDFGLSDLVTISPFIGYNQLHSFQSDTEAGQYLHVGISILFRNDYKRRFR